MYMENNHKLLVQIANDHKLIVQIAKDVSILKKDVSTLKKDVITINKYIKNENIVKEIKANLLIETFLLKNDILFQKLSWSFVYNKKGKIITDLDGCYLINISLKRNVDNIINNITSRNYVIRSNFKSKINKNSIMKIIEKENKKETFPIPEKLIIVESKNYFDKYQINKKIKQLYQINEVINDSKNIKNNNSKIFKSMIDEHKINKLPNNLYLVICGYIKNYNLEYIKKCNKGITEEEYNHIELMNLIDSYEFIELTKHYRKLRNQIDITSIYTFTESLTNLIDENPDEILLLKLKNQIIPYNSFKLELDFIKGKIGYLFYNEEFLLSLKT